MHTFIIVVVVIIIVIIIIIIIDARHIVEVHLVTITTSIPHCEC
jgi:uncharacterized integral membrane protein